MMWSGKSSDEGVWTSGNGRMAAGRREVAFAQMTPSAPSSPSPTSAAVAAANKDAATATVPGITTTAPEGFDNAAGVYKPDARVPLDLTFGDEAGHDVKLAPVSSPTASPSSSPWSTMNVPTCSAASRLSGLLQLACEIADPAKSAAILTSSPSRSIPTNTRTSPRPKNPVTSTPWATPPPQPAGISSLRPPKPGPSSSADALGFFGFKYNASKAKQYLHQSAIYLCMPDGRVSRMIEGPGFDKDVINDGLINASQGKLGSPVFQVASFCGFYEFDGNTGRYVPVAQKDYADQLACPHHDCNGSVHSWAPALAANDARKRRLAQPGFPADQHADPQFDQEKDTP